MGRNEIIEEFKKLNCDNCNNKDKCEGITIDIENKPKCIAKL